MTHSCNFSAQEGETGGSQSYSLAWFTRPRLKKIKPYSLTVPYYIGNLGLVQALYSCHPLYSHVIWLLCEISRVFVFVFLLFATVLLHSVGLS